LKFEKYYVLMEVACSARFLATEGVAPLAGTEDTEVFIQNCMNPKELRNHREKKCEV